MGVIDGIRNELPNLPDEFTTKQLVRAANKTRMSKHRRPLMRGAYKKWLFRMVDKGELREAAFNRWVKL